MADASTATRPATPETHARRHVPGFSTHSVWAMYRFQMVRFFRTIGESLATPVITTALYFVVFGSAIGGRMQPVVEGLEYGSFLVPGLIMLSIFTNSIFNASFGIYFPKFTGTIYELLSAPISYFEIVIAFVGAAATKSVILGSAAFWGCLIFGIIFLAIFAIVEKKSPNAAFLKPTSRQIFLAVAHLLHHLCPLSLWTDFDHYHPLLSGTEWWTHLSDEWLEHALVFCTLRAATGGRF